MPFGDPAGSFSWPITCASKSGEQPFDLQGFAERLPPRLLRGITTLAALPFGMGSRVTDRVLPTYLGFN